MKEKKFNKINSNDEILNTLLKTNFDSNIKDESLDINMSACVTITTATTSNSSNLSSEFWKTLDENAQIVDGTSDIYNGPLIEEKIVDFLHPLSNLNLHLTKNVTKISIPIKTEENAIENIPKTIKTNNYVQNNENSQFDFKDILNVDGLESAGIRFKYKCEHCSSILNSLAEFTAHETSHKIIFKCAECNREFENESGFKKHAKIHRNVNRKDVWQECPECGKSLKHGSMWMHRKIHADSKRYVCDICGQKFVQKINLIHHTKVHTGEKPFECSECQKTFPEKSHLLRHQKYHISTRPFGCEKCGKMYKTERCLKVHNLVHLEQRPFVCQVCSKSFISNSKLKQHSNIHTGERPYKCNYCSRDFTNFPNWLKHTRRRHKVDHKTGELLENIPNYCTKQKSNTKEPKKKDEKSDTIEKKEINSTTKRKRKPKITANNIEIKLENENNISESIKTELNKNSIPFDDMHCLSITSTEDLLMDQALEMEDALLGNGNHLPFNINKQFSIEDFGPICSVDTSPFSSPASIIELPKKLSLSTLPSITINSLPTTTTTDSLYLRGTNYQVHALPSVETILNSGNFLKINKN